MKFAIGSRVMFTDLKLSSSWESSSVWGNAPVKYGLVVSIEKDWVQIRFDDCKYSTSSYEGRGDCHSMNVTALETEDIYNSPLNQVLK